MSRLTLLCRWVLNRVRTQFGSSASGSLLSHTVVSVSSVGSCRSNLPNHRQSLDLQGLLQNLPQSRFWIWDRMVLDSDPLVLGTRHSVWDFLFHVPYPTTTFSCVLPSFETKRCKFLCSFLVPYHFPSDSSWTITLCWTTGPLRNSVFLPILTEVYGLPGRTYFPFSGQELLTSLEKCHRLLYFPSPFFTYWFYVQLTGFRQPSTCLWFTWLFRLYFSFRVLNTLWGSIFNELEIYSTKVSITISFYDSHSITSSYVLVYTFV